MKKILIAVGIVFLAAACKDAKHNEPAAHDEKQDHSTHATALSLNDGKKWKADSSTHRNVAHLSGVITAFNAGADTTLNGYLQTAASLQEGLDRLISDCRMQGKDHDMLHLWLEPLLGQVKKFSGATNGSDAGKQLSEITEQVKLFDQYFE